MEKRIFALAAAMLVWVGVEAWPAMTQTSVVQGVTVAVTPGSLAADAGIWDFAVSFDAGVRRLDDEILDDAVLVGDGMRIKPLAWEGEPAGVRGHRAGVLKFVAPKPRPREFQLELARPGEARPRVFHFVFGEWSA